MESNPYAPPTAYVADSPANAGSTDAPIFFPVSLTKLTVLSICTLGLYEIYWFYMNWRIIRDRTREEIAPFWRAFFAVFFCYQLFDQVRKYSSELPAARLPAGVLATAWIVLSISSKLPDPYWFLFFLASFVLLPVQHAINGINHAVAPRHAPNFRLTAWNWLAVVIGGPMFLLVCLGLFFGSALPDQ